MADGQFWEQTFSVNDAGREVQLPARGTGLSLTDEVGCNKSTASQQKRVAFRLYVVS